MLLSAFFFLLCVVNIFIADGKNQAVLLVIAIALAAGNAVSYAGSRLMHGAMGSGSALRDFFIAIHAGSSVFGILFFIYLIISGYMK